MPDSLPAGPIAAIEAGGTKVLCALANLDGQVLAQTRIPTHTPDETFAAIQTFYDQRRETFGPIAAGGVASFGPLDLDRESEGYGHLTTTPKPGWSGVDMRGRIAAILAAPTSIDTDVSCAGVAEGLYGAGRGLGRFCYVTVGTGIGVGVIEQGRALGGVGHPEAGHLRVARALGDDFKGICPYHNDCLEGLACGPAIAARWGRDGETLPDTHPAWAVEAHYLAVLCANLTYTLRPERIILGGGVMARPGFHAFVRTAFVDLCGYYALDRCSADPNSFICAPMAEDPSPGLLGALELARACASDHVTQ
jgi:fructokinase